MKYRFRYETCALSGWSFFHIPNPRAAGEISAMTPRYDILANQIRPNSVSRGVESIRVPCPRVNTENPGMPAVRLDDNRQNRVKF